jgi:O-antigen biosynthesis protein
LTIENTTFEEIFNKSILVNKILIIGTVWPEPKSTAAGSRIMQLIELFRLQNWEIIFASTAAESEFSANLETLQIKKETIVLNDSGFDDFIKKLNPTIVIFDRFMTEEQFGWRVAENCPTALRILDTEDLHFLRTVRQDNFRKGKKTSEADFLNSEVAKREVASIYRCDLSLIISTAEMDILQNIFKITPQILIHTPFLLEKMPDQILDTFPTFAERRHFITIGNFRHEPNWDAVLYLKKTVFPLIRKELPTAELHIYGSYFTQKAQELHNPKEGFLIKGRAEDAETVIKNARVLLAPLRFGAGIKGKLTDAMLCGTPSVTTKIGAEGMHANLAWNGAIADDEKEFSKAAVALYKDENLWRNAQNNGKNIIHCCYDKTVYGKQLVDRMVLILNNLKEHRTENFVGQMLQYHLLKSTKYMSKWIEEKGKV